MSTSSTLGGRLYRGETAVDFVGRRRTWYIISAVLFVIALSAIGINRLNLGVEFTGGAVFTVPTETGTVQQAEDAVKEVGITDEPIITIA
jgi:preprotein translocase subunit SecF